MMRTIVCSSASTPRALSAHPSSRESSLPEPLVSAAAKASRIGFRGLEGDAGSGTTGSAVGGRPDCTSSISRLNSVRLIRRSSSRSYLSSTRCTPGPSASRPSSFSAPTSSRMSSLPEWFVSS
eukprot:scaffold1054_cov116-Isochrysis_galbana.AAC.31